MMWMTLILEWKTIAEKREALIRMRSKSWNEERREQTLQRREETTTSEGWFDEGLHETKRRA